MSVTRWAASFLCAWGAFSAAALADDKPKEPAPHLEFRILANAKDDADGLDAAAKYLKAAKNDEKRSAELQKCAEEGAPPPAGEAAAGATLKYAWVEVAPAELRSLRVIEGAKNPGDDSPGAENRERMAKETRERVAKAREAGEAVPVGPGYLFFSRNCQNAKLSKEDREKKQYDCFLLTRLPEPGKAVTGAHLVNVKAGTDAAGRNCVNFAFDKEGGERFHELTSKNAPEGLDTPEPFHRALAIIVDGRVFSAPNVNSPIGQYGQISGDFTREELDAITETLRIDLPKDK